VKAWVALHNILQKGLVGRSVLKEPSENETLGAPFDS
jgi:hypothetical protein